MIDEKQLDRKVLAQIVHATLLFEMLEKHGGFSRKAEDAIIEWYVK